MASINTLTKIAKISKITGFTRLCYLMNRNRKRTIAYHNIIPDKYFDNSLHLSHSMKESSFKKQLEIINYRFGGTTLDIEDTEKVTLTFDDGYLNQYLLASKLMDKQNMKGYFFCVANLIKNNEPFIMDKLQYWFSYVPCGVYEIKEINIKLEIRDEDSRVTEWKKIDDVIGEIAIERAEELLNKTYPFNKIHINEEFYQLRYNHINEIQLDDMKKNGHKIGAHTASHKRLSVMDREELKEDIAVCKEMLNSTYNTDVFCYPFGSKCDINNDVIEEIKNQGFTKSFAYCNGHIDEGYNTYFMPRIFLYDTDDEDLIDFVLSGAKHFISFRKLLPKIG